MSNLNSNCEIYTNMHGSKVGDVDANQPISNFENSKHM